MLKAKAKDSKFVLEDTSIAKDLGQGQQHCWCLIVRPVGLSVSRKSRYFRIIFNFQISVNCESSEQYNKTTIAHSAHLDIPYITSLV